MLHFTCSHIQDNTMLISPISEAVPDCGEMLQTLWRNKAGYWWIGKSVWWCCKRVPAACREGGLSAPGHSVHAGKDNAQLLYAYLTSYLQAAPGICKLSYLTRIRGTAPSTCACLFMSDACVWGCAWRYALFDILERTCLLTFLAIVCCFFCMMSTPHWMLTH